MPVDNTRLHRATRNLFKNRKKLAKQDQERRKKALFKIENKPKPYRPPGWLVSSSNQAARDFASSSVKVPKSPPPPKPLVLGFESFKKNQAKSPKLSWPPALDSNYSKVTPGKPFELPLYADSPQHAHVHLSLFTYKFVDCDLCGHKNLSSVRQLRIHQASKKCVNRRKRLTNLRCPGCHLTFDNKHNLEHHICRLN